MKKLFDGKYNFKFIGRLLLVIVAAVSIVFIAASSFSNVTFSNITGTVESFFLNLKKGEGYPYQCSADGPQKATAISSHLAVIDDSNVILLNKTAKEILKFDSTYTNPDIAVSNGRALIYNRGASSFSVIGQSDVLYDNNATAEVLKEAVITANISKNGSLGFATWTDDGVCKFSAFNKKLGAEFYYVFGSERILYVTLSDNGKYGACAVLGVENATYYSAVYVFDFSSPDPVKVVKYPGETAIRLDFLSKKKLNVITDLKRRVISLSDEEDTEEIDYSAHTLNSVDFDTSSKRSVICYSKYGSTSNVICAFYKNGKESCKIEDVENVKSVSCNKNYFAVLTDDKVLCYNYSGKLKCTVELKFNVDSVELGDSEVYLFSGSNIYRAKLNRDSVLEADEL